MPAIGWLMVANASFCHNLHRVLLDRYWPRAWLLIFSFGAFITRFWTRFGLSLRPPVAHLWPRLRDDRTHPLGARHTYDLLADHSIRARGHGSDETACFCGNAGAHEGGLFVRPKRCLAWQVKRSQFATWQFRTHPLTSVFS